VAETVSNRPVFSEQAAETLLALPRRRQRRAMDRARELARAPLHVSDYALRDEDGREIEHLLTDGLVFSYWVDHAVRLVMIVEIEDVA